MTIPIVGHSDEPQFSEREFVPRWVVRADGRDVFRVETRRLVEGDYLARAVLLGRAWRAITSHVFDHRENANAFARRLREAERSAP